MIFINRLIFLASLSVIFLIKRAIYKFWICSAYEVGIVDEYLIFYCGNKTVSVLLTNCLSIEEKDNGYIILFLNNKKLFLRKKVYMFEFISNPTVESIRSIITQKKNTGDGTMS